MSPGDFIFGHVTRLRSHNPKRQRGTKSKFPSLTLRVMNNGSHRRNVALTHCPMRLTREPSRLPQLKRLSLSLVQSARRLSLSMTVPEVSPSWGMGPAGKERGLV